MSTFTPNRSLLNPKFDGYKLAPLTHDQVASHYPLQYKISQTNVSGRAPLSFKEVQSRVFHNHLAVSHRVAYVDAELRVIAVDIDKVTLVPSFRVLYELPKPIQSSAVETPQREYPSAAFVDDTSLFISDGCGNLYALRLADTGAAELLSVFELSIPPAYASARSSVPFRIHDAVQVASGAAVVILSSKHYPEISPDPSQSRSKSPPVKFDVWAVRVALPIVASPEYTQPLDIIWHRRGDDVPVYTVYDASRGAFMLVGSSSFQPIEVAAPVSYEPSSDEIAPIPRQGENVDTDTQLKKPPPYSWTQTSDSVTVAIPLPSSTPTSNIKVAFSPHSLTVLVEGATDAGDIPIVAPRYTLKKLWDGIKASTSLWTFDRAAEHTYGMLSLHLEKQHEGTRWAHVFSSAGTGEDVEVPETLDPTELYAIRDVLEKYTAALRGGQDASGLGLGRGVPSLAEGERDDEVDLAVGRSVCLTWVGADGSQPSYGHGDDSPVSLLSSPFPSVDLGGSPSLVVKNGLDGVVYSLQAGTGPGDKPAWVHSSTFSALGFVLASKQDTRFVHHVASQAVFAFESGAQDLGGNVYIYRGTGVRDNWAKQAVLKIGGGSAGSLLGVGLVQAQDRPVILCLCEGELIVLHGVL